MGSCSSVDRETDSTMRYRLGMNLKGRGLFVPAPAKEKSLDGANHVGDWGSKSPKLGNGATTLNTYCYICYRRAIKNDEIFYDSRAWLDSDCEDDFFSVKGDFTPSRGSTPVHHASAPLTPRLENSFFVDKYPDSRSEPSPTGRKKLGELFQETSQVEQAISVPNAPEQESFKQKANTDRLSRSSNGTPNHSSMVSSCSTEVTPSRDPRIRKEKIWKTRQCCLPNFNAFGFDDRRQKMSSGACTA